ncbi:hypothetical protein F4860DRAFT_458037 [Xylaria cubensis]|nr:hypothetical protein F4860DRAFT_458037 [Xylaria cubensis]
MQQCLLESISSRYSKTIISNTTNTSLVASIVRRPGASDWDSISADDGYQKLGSLSLGLRELRVLSDQPRDGGVERMSSSIRHAIAIGLPGDCCENTTRNAMLERLVVRCISRQRFLGSHSTPKNS